ncbi:GntR family transcriptional regulator [Paenibacillus mendelii]|uniref:GntR family transcriptional regulator n=1 Tax=Paenibacillus mendelii TaxID=206163 RepID=A0ABV6J431_9BACL|nr:GntR family transcriptional regulator [Paenibacillus mendelii]MCQ6559411.1 GntR family transcriptional regulator [Paenibacillus mendelii]
MLKNQSPEESNRNQQTKEVIRIIRMNIISGKLTSESSIVESQLAAELGVSRGPIRAALQSLEQEGLVKSMPNGRTVVVGFTLKAVEDIFDLRLMLEHKALQLILDNEMVDYFPILAVLDRIREVNNHANIEDLTQTITEVDIQFHRSIMIMSENHAILQAWNLMANTIYAALNISNGTFYTDFFEYYKSHKRLSDLIIQRNPLALDEITLQITHSKDLVSTQLKKHLKS